MITYPIIATFAIMENTNMKEAKEIIELFNSNLDLPPLTPKLVRTLYTALYRLDPNKSLSGICVIANNLGGYEITLLLKIFPLWSEFSGNYHYPIKAPAYLAMTEEEAYFFYCKTSSMWHKDAIYGAARRRLHSFCLYVLEDLLQYYRDVGTYTLQSSK